MPFTLPHTQRLKKPAQFQSVYQSKQWGGSRYFTFNVLAKESISPQKPILGVTVSKKVSKRAVDRNRIKRQIREFFRKNQAQLTDAELIITAKPNCIKANDVERNDSLDELWTKVQKWQSWHKRQADKPKD